MPGRGIIKDIASFILYCEIFIILSKFATSTEAVIEFKRPLFQLEQNTKQWRVIHSLPRQRFRKWQLQ